METVVPPNLLSLLVRHESQYTVIKETGIDFLIRTHSEIPCPGVMKTILEEQLRAERLTPTNGGKLCPVTLYRLFQGKEDFLREFDPMDRVD